MINKEWYENYEKVKDKLNCNVDLESYFTFKQGFFTKLFSKNSQNTVAGKNVRIIDAGKLNLPTGKVFACDPYFDMEDAKPFIQSVPAGKYPVSVCEVSLDEKHKRFACLKVAISDNKPVRYELGMFGDEDFDDESEYKEGEFYGYSVETGMSCIADMQTQEKLVEYAEELQEDEDYPDYQDVLSEIEKDEDNKNPGNWLELLNSTVPETDCNIVILEGGFGDGAYPTYFAYDKNEQVCGIYIFFIDIEKVKE